MSVITHIMGNQFWVRIHQNVGPTGVAKTSFMHLMLFNKIFSTF